LIEHKKSLGQHFLHDVSVLDKIREGINELQPIHTLIEVGPGLGALTKRMIDMEYTEYYLIEKDDRFVKRLPIEMPYFIDKIFHQDVLKFDFSTFGHRDLTIIGNYPYNISNQIMFWIIENESYVKQSVGMFQKEVAKRIASKHGSKDYGILSVLTQAFYEVEYLFDIGPEAFDPPPKVVSGVIRMRHLSEPKADYSKLKRVVKAAFNQRRKMLSNSLKGFQFTEETALDSYKNLRPEQLSVDDFCLLSKWVL
jgi:16S rRNA (adenine1518-N6/adenine1519-N6)-dimethyltransferase